MGKDGIDLLIAIKKRPNFRTQRDCKIQDEIDGNSLGKPLLSYSANAQGDACNPSARAHLLDPVWNLLQSRYAAGLAIEAKIPKFPMS